MVLDSEEYPRALKNYLCNGLTAFVEDKSSILKLR
jgi:hypothetical protein